MDRMKDGGNKLLTSFFPSKVYFQCGNEHGILSVSEPRTCHYQMEFQTPLACPLDAMVGKLFYPRERDCFCSDRAPCCYLD